MRVAGAKLLGSVTARVGTFIFSGVHVYWSLESLGSAGGKERHDNWTYGAVDLE